jgi:hypothetical protein
MAEYQAELRAMREKTARLRALRLARDAANQNALSAAPLQRPAWEPRRHLLPIRSAQ